MNEKKKPPPLRRSGKKKKTRTSKKSTAIHIMQWKLLPEWEAWIVTRCFTYAETRLYGSPCERELCAGLL